MRAINIIEYCVPEIGIQLGGSEKRNLGIIEIIIRNKKYFFAIFDNQLDGLK